MLQIANAFFKLYVTLTLVLSNESARGIVAQS